LPKITILRSSFPSKVISKCCNLSMDWDSVKGFSASITHYIMIDQRSFLTSPKFSSRLGGLPPLQTPKQKGEYPSSDNRRMYIFDRWRRRKSNHFFSNIL
jgi:hypothetical protein